MITIQPSGEHALQLFDHTPDIHANTTATPQLLPTNVYLLHIEISILIASSKLAAASKIVARPVTPTTESFDSARCDRHPHPNFDLL